MNGCKQCRLPRGTFLLGRFSFAIIFIEEQMLRLTSGSGLICYLRAMKAQLQHQIPQLHLICCMPRYMTTRRDRSRQARRDAAPEAACMQALTFHASHRQFLCQIHACISPFLSGGYHRRTCSTSDESSVRFAPRGKRKRVTSIFAQLSKGATKYFTSQLPVRT